jgi:uncharacterized protein YutD
MKNKLFIAITMSLMTGCASMISSRSQMPETHYEGFSLFAANLQECFEKEYISPQLYADAKNAFSNTLNTWSYDRNKLMSMYDAEYKSANAYPEICRQAEADAYQLISQNSQNRANQRQNQTDVNNALKEFKVNKPIFCNTIGTITTCN